MHLGPGKDKSKLSPPESAVHHLERVDPDLSPAAIMPRVEMRMAVIIEVHRDHDPEEAANSRHGLMVPTEAVAKATNH